MYSHFIINPTVIEIWLVSCCHGRVAGRTREARARMNIGILMTEHRIHNYNRRVNGQRLKGNSGLINT